MSFNDLSPELRNEIRRKIDVSDDFEFAAGVLLDRIDEQTNYNHDIGYVLEEIFDYADLKIEVSAADVYVVDEK